MTLTCVAISDTHRKHAEIVLPEADVLIHASDFLGHGHGTRFDARRGPGW